MEVTLQDIAKELDLSAATISRSLRHDKAIHPETRARVNEVARRMGYKGGVGRPRRPVEAGTKTGVLGLLVRHNNLDDLQHDTNLMKMMAGMMSVADKHGMHLKVHPHGSGYMEEDAALIPPMIQEGVCQSLIVHGTQEERDLTFLAHRLPVVSITRAYPDLPIDAAIADNIEGIQKLVGHLAELGHRHLAWVGLHFTATFIAGREAGFIQGCRKHGLEFGPSSFFGTEIYEKDAIHDKDALLAAVNAGVTAFVCGNDGAALKVINILEAAGKRVPEDVSVTGFDAEPKKDPAKARHITSVDPNFFEMGKVAARLALQRVLNPMDPPCIVSVRANVVLGDTTAPPPEVAISQ